MTLREALLKTTTISYAASGPPVLRTVAEALVRDVAPQAAPIGLDDASNEPEPGEVRVALADDSGAWLPSIEEHRPPEDSDWMFIQVSPSGTGALLASCSNLAYAMYGRLEREWVHEEATRFETGVMRPAAFHWAPGMALIGEVAVVGRSFDAEEYVRECARLGLTHIAVNGLASLFTVEPETPGEVYPVFYRHGPGLDQYVASRLNRGVFPTEYLRANLSVLKRNAELALRYGMTPGMQVVEPRSVPDELLRRYPMLRGARVDHPFRSLRPRYNLSIAHPVVRDHYAELMANLLGEVPELGFMSIATNDCGAGFEHTRFMYAGRNGGAYLIREWHTDDEIAAAASDNVNRFTRLLRDSAAKINPDFRVILGMGPLEPERDLVWPGFTDGVDPADGLATISAEERQKLRQRGSLAHVGAAVAPFCNPLIGTPAPWVTHANLLELVDQNVEALTGAGDVALPSAAPWCINHEVWRTVQLSRTIDIDTVVQETATRWVGAELAPALIQAWRGADAALAAYSPQLGLWSGYGFVPYRLWVRPLIPNIEAVSEEDRSYYEDLMLSVPNNPTRIDLSVDILFELNTPDEALAILRQMDGHVWAPLVGAIESLTRTVAELSAEAEGRAVLVDQLDRIRALRCWLETQRCVAAWIAGVRGYMEAEDEAGRARCRALLPDMVEREIANTRELLDLWENSTTEFMTVSAADENTFTYGENFGELLQRRIELMEGHEDDEPYIDPDFMWRVPGIS